MEGYVSERKISLQVSFKWIINMHPFHTWVQILYQPKVWSSMVRVHRRRNSYNSNWTCVVCVREAGRDIFKILSVPGYSFLRNLCRISSSVDERQPHCFREDNGTPTEKQTMSLDMNVTQEQSRTFITTNKDALPWGKQLVYILLG